MKDLLVTTGEFKYLRMLGGCYQNQYFHFTQVVQSFTVY